VSILSRKNISDWPSVRTMCWCTDIMLFQNPPYRASRQLLIPRIAAAGTSFSPLPCQTSHGYILTIAHRVEVEVGADGPASAPPSTAAAVAPPGDACVADLGVRGGSPRGVGGVARFRRTLLGKASHSYSRVKGECRASWSCANSSLRGVVTLGSSQG
jgi:hypothetical protein